MTMANGLDKVSFLSGASGAFIENLHARFKENPQAVDFGWQQFFAELGDEAEAVEAAARGPSWGRRGLFAIEDGELPARAAASGLEGRAATLDSIRALMMIRVYRVRGHLIADLDPLGLEAREYHPELDFQNYGFTEADLDRPIFIDHVLGLETATLREIIEILRLTYCGTIGYEFMHIQDPDQKSWIQMRIENQEYHANFTGEGKLKILRQLTESEGFERFLHLKYPGTKRFGLDGSESLIPALEAIIRRASQLGVVEIGLGMPHRGRLNVLANIMHKAHTAMFSEFEGMPANPDDVQGSGDVKYHLGTSSDRETDGQAIHLSLLPNPSHLEAVNPVVLGRSRAKQGQLGDDERRQVLAVLMHGDAAFAGQGLVAECFGMSQLHGYRTGGTIHIIVNNQIGFTTAPIYSRSSPYPSDVAKMVQAPILHVNGDDPESVVHVARMATEFRQEFGQDVVVDMFCYRRHGHNEGDEPAFTQPIMYRKIAQHPSSRQLYARRLAEEGSFAEVQSEAMVKEHHDHLQLEFEAAKGYKPNKADWLEGRWSDFTVAHGEDRRGRTEAGKLALETVGRALTRVPEDFNLHRTVERLLKTKRQNLEAGGGIDWATGEALAFGNLLLEGVPVRLSGQDSGRGTFSQRHAVLTDQTNEQKYIPLNNIAPRQAKFEVIDSMLSEAAVLGFEYGFTLAEPRALVLWEAQFGDFANGAQVIIDQFLASGETKWLRMSGLVMLLPHGQEGQGPEHSSARLERYLQICAEDNMQVANCTTPASYFHILRRQIHRDFRKPLILMTPKSLLRHRQAISPLSDFALGSSFHRVLWDGSSDLKSDAKIRRVVLCSGKVYYDLFAEREKLGIDDVYMLRLEQLYPFPAKALTKELARFPKADIVWCQEEPENMGAWNFVDRRIEAVLAGIGHKAGRPSYAGRPEMSAPAPGTIKLHNKQQQNLVEAALVLRGKREGG